MDSDVITRAKQRARELLCAYDESRVKSDYTVAVPTSDSDVRLRLRQLGQPICLFSEDPFSRRERLKLVVASAKVGEMAAPTPGFRAEKPQTTQTFYTHGSASLLSCRNKIAKVSHAASVKRLSKERINQGRGSEDSFMSEYWNSSKIYSISQIGDSRPLSYIAYSPDGGFVGVSGWSGDVNIFKPDDRALTQVFSLRGHDDRCTSFAWNEVEGSRIQIASGGVDRRIHLWNLLESPLDGIVLGPADMLEGHELRVNRIAFHPHVQNLLASTSEDETWRLWDLERKEEILLQEGHVAPVFGASFHPDGSLLATSDTAGVIRLWDLRTGRSIMGFEGLHVEQVIGLDFAANGFNLASCSGDNTVRVWDIRRRKCLEVLTAHEKLVSSVRYSNNGSVLITAGYDCVARIWRTSDYKIIKNLPIHESRIMAADISPDGKAVVSACYDRTFKMWRRDSDDVLLKMEH